MINIDVIWANYDKTSQARGYWDQALVEDLLSNKLWDFSDVATFIHHDSFSEVKTGAVVVIPGRQNYNKVEALNQDIKNLDWVIIMITGDEEATFPCKNVRHNNAYIYVMSPREDIDRNKYGVLGTGYPPQLHKQFNNTNYPSKETDVFFAGQVTHDRRIEMFNALESDRNTHPSVLLASGGFTQGYEQEDYFNYFKSAKIAPAPSGPQTPDSFRLFEALEIGLVPIADTVVSKGGFTTDYWRFFFNEEPPFPIIVDYDKLPDYIDDQVRLYPSNANKIQAWWINKKREFAYNFIHKFEELSGVDVHLEERVTVIIPVSPIKSHPSTDILDQTIKSIRYHLPTSEIIVTFDGVRGEQVDKVDDYEEFKRRALWNFNFNHKNITPVIFYEHMHQTGMMKNIIDDIKTKLIMYVEQDTPLVIDEEIAFDDIFRTILSGDLNVVRLYHEGVIPREHEYLMHGLLLSEDTKFVKTSQWSQRPHVSTIAFYRDMLNSHFSENSKSFIEDKMHGVLQNAYNDDGMQGWNLFRVAIYCPGDNMKRSYHTDGRAGEQKFDDTQVF